MAADTQAKWQEIANRGLQDQFAPEQRAKFDEAVKRGLIVMPGDSVSAPTAPTPTEESGSFLGRVGSAAVQGGNALSNTREFIGNATGDAVSKIPLSMIADLTTGGLKMLVDTFSQDDELKPIMNDKGELVGTEPRNTVFNNEDLFPLTTALATLEGKNVVEEGSAEDIIGSTVGFIADPINLAFGLGSTFKGMTGLMKLSGISAGIGATQDTAQQLAQGDEFDVGELGLVTATSAASPFVMEGILGLARGAGTVLSKAKNSKFAKARAEKKANTMVEKVTLRAAQNMDEGLNSERAVAAALTKEGYGPVPFWEQVGKRNPNASGNEVLKPAGFKQKPADPKSFTTNKKLQREALENEIAATRAKIAKEEKLGVGKQFINKAGASWRKANQKVRKPFQMVDDLALRSVATQLERIHPALGKSLRFMEMKKYEMVGEHNRAVTNWRKGYNALPKNVKKDIDLALANGERTEAIKIMQQFDNSPVVQRAISGKTNFQQGTEAVFGKFPELDAAGNKILSPATGVSRTFSQEFEGVTDSLARMGTLLQESKQVGKGIDLLDDYFPRVSKNHQDFLENTVRGRAILAKQKDFLEKEATRLGRPLSPSEAEDVIARELSKPEITSRLPKARAENKRKFDRIRDEEHEFYMNSSQALESYIHNTSEIVAQRHLIGTAQDAGTEALSDIQFGINKVINQLMDAGEIKVTDMPRIQALLNARLGNGTAQMWNWLGASKNVFYASTLGDFSSAIVQFGDTSLATVLNGMDPSIRAIAKTIANRNSLPDIDASKTFDLIRLSDEMVESRSFAGAVQNIFKWSGFSAVDKFGKNVNIQSTLSKAGQLAQGDDAIAALQKQFGNDIFTPDEWAGVVKDLRSGTVSENLKFLTWNVLSDAQPVSLSEMPATYLNNPNGRIFYAMKSYALKQVDLVRKRGFDLLGTPGRQAEGMEFLARYGAFLGTANLGIEEINQYLMGKEMDRGDHITDDIAWAAWKGLGMSKFFIDSFTEAVASNDVVELAQAMFMPAALEHVGKLGEQTIEAGKALVNGTEDVAKQWKIIRSIPLVGEVMYNYMFEGAEAWNEWAESVASEE